ncbi:MAG: hypothetical protein JW929_12510 [Anaerolineales bacterium]|nr:hypothetical protein [Anaerolineales bacterium]
MFSPARSHENPTDSRGAWRAAVFAAVLCGPVFLAACGGGSTPTAAGGMAFATVDTAPTADPMAAYPPPGDSAQATPDPKSAPHAAGTNAVYLPAVINQKPPQYPFEIQQTGVLAVQGFFGCDWSGVAGQVFDLSGAPIKNLYLHLEGFWNGAAVSRDALSGSAEQYGSAGYEFVLGTQPAGSSQTLWIQVLDASRKEISPRVYFDTFQDCARNLILVNFVQVR